MSKNVKSIIIFLFHFNKGGGAEEVVTNLANEMARQGIRVRILCVKNGTMFPELDQTVEQIHCDSNYRKAFLCLMKSFKTFDVLFTTQRFASVFAYIAKRISFSKIKFVLREAGTERPFSSSLNNIKEAGTFVCAACSNPLYKTKHKFDSGTGWPSFDRAIENSLAYSSDKKLGYQRDEALCGKCGGHLGHIFDDGPRDTTGKRHCINGVALEFIPENK